MPIHFFVILSLACTAIIFVQPESISKNIDTISASKLTHADTMAMNTTMHIINYHRHTIWAWAIDTPFKKVSYNIYERPANIHQLRSVELQTHKQINFYILTIILIFFAWIRLTFYYNWKSYFKKLQNINVAAQHFHDQYNNFNIGELFFKIAFILILSAALATCIQWQTPSNNYKLLSQFAITVLYVSSILIFRELILKSLSILLPIGDDVDFYIYNVDLIYKTSLVLLLPLTFYFMLVNYNNLLINRSLLAIYLFGVIIFGWYKGGLIAQMNRSNKSLHFILYFCTFEILLVALLTKWIYVKMI